MRRTLICLLAAFMSASPAFAQMSVNFSNIGSSVAGITTPVVLNPCTGGRCSARSRGSSASARLPVAASRGVVYQASPAQQRAAVNGYVSRIARTDPAAAKAVAQAFARQDYSRLYNQLTAGSGLRSNNAIDVMTAYTLLGWMISNNHLGAIDNGRVAAIRAQVADGFLRDPRLTAPGVPARLGEELKLLYLTLHDGWSASRNEGRLREYSDGVARMLRAQSGRDMRSLRLTSNGLEATRTGALDRPSPRSEEQAYAEVKAEDAAGSSRRPTYILAATVGGAGVAGAYLFGRRSARRS